MVSTHSCWMLSSVGVDVEGVVVVPVSLGVSVVSVVSVVSEVSVSVPEVGLAPVSDGET